MLDADQAQPRAPGRDRSVQGLHLQMRLGLEAILVEDLRGVGAQAWMEPPRRFEEHPQVFGHGGSAVQQVAEGGSIGPRWVGALGGLVELLRVTQEHERAGTLGRRQDVGERHLPRLVHEQDIDRPGHVLPRPEPRGPGGHLRGARLEGGPDRGVVLGDGHRVVPQLILGTGHLLDDADGTPPLSAASIRARRKLPMTLWLLAVMPIRFPCAPGPGPCAPRCRSCRNPAGPEWRGWTDQSRPRVASRRRGSPRAGRSRSPVAWPARGGRRRSRSARHDWRGLRPYRGPPPIHRGAAARPRTRRSRIRTLE